MPEPAIRLATPDEASGVADVLREAFAPYRPQYTPDRLVVLSTTPFLHPAIALYERCGFARTGEGPVDLAGTPLVTMTKAL